MAPWAADVTSALSGATQLGGGSGEQHAGAVGSASNAGVGFSGSSSAGKGSMGSGSSSSGAGSGSSTSRPNDESVTTTTTSSTRATVAYRGLFRGADPAPTRDAGAIMMSSHLLLKLGC